MRRAVYIKTSFFCFSNLMQKIKPSIIKSSLEAGVKMAILQS